MNIRRTRHYPSSVNSEYRISFILACDFRALWWAAPGCLRPELANCRTNVYIAGININGIIRRQARITPWRPTTSPRDTRVTRVNFQREINIVRRVGHQKQDISRITAYRTRTSNKQPRIIKARSVIGCVGSITVHHH